MPTQINFNEDTRKGIKDGINQVADAVKITLGPRGKYVIIEQDYGPPLITADGAKIIEEIQPGDGIEGEGVKVQQDVARKVSELSGDGRTAACIITQSLTNEGFKNVAAGADAVAMGRGLTYAKDAVLGHLTGQATPNPTQEQIAQVAAVAAGDKKLGVAVASILNEVGLDGIVTVEDSKVLGITEDVVKGFQFDRGYLPPYVATKNNEIAIEDALIFITDKHISETEDIAPLVEKVLAAGKQEMVIIAEDVSYNALNWLNACKMKGGFAAIIIKKPGQGDDGKNQLEDLALYTGAKIVSESLGMKLTDTGLDVLGRAKRVITNKTKTIILEGESNLFDVKHSVDMRVEQLKKELAESEIDFEKIKIKERLAKLTGGIGVLRIGYATEIQRGILDKAKDALKAARGATEQGIVPGGGISLIAAIKAIDKLKLVGDEETGADILRRALEQPLRRLAINSGVDDGVVVDRVKKINEAQVFIESLGFNAENGNYENLIKSGIIDSVKTVKATVDIPASAVATLLNAGAGITKVKLK